MQEGDNAVARQVLQFKSKLGGLVRHFICSDEAISSYERFFKYVEEDVKLLRFASNALGSYSDSFILYAVSCLGICDEATISAFLASISKRNPDLHIMDYNNRDFLKKRLYVLYKNGFLFKHTYKQIYYYDGLDKEQDENVSLYSTSSATAMFVNQHLDKHMGINTWIQAKPLSELIGWASGSYIASKVAQDKSFIEYKEGNFLSRSLGKVFTCCEIKTHTDADYYISFVYSYMYHDKRLMTERDFKENCLRKINVILNYLNIRGKGDRNACVVVAVQDANDLDNFIDWIIKSEVLAPHLDKIFFTGEGVVKSGSLNMLQVSLKGDTPTLRVVKPYFLLLE